MDNGMSKSLLVLFAKEPILKHPDPEQAFVVQADTSDMAVGAVLLQTNKQGNLQPCGYTSHKLDTERQLAIWEKEAYAVWWALMTWQHLLEGSHVSFEVWMDHKNLKPPKLRASCPPNSSGGYGILNASILL